MDCSAFSFVRLNFFAVSVDAVTLDEDVLPFELAVRIAAVGALPFFSTP